MGNSNYNEIVLNRFRRISYKEDSVEMFMKVMESFFVMCFVR